MGWMFRLSFLNMKRRTARTVLTVLGVTIGVISVVSLLALGLGIKRELLSEFGDESTVKNITVYSGDSYKNKSLLLNDRLLDRLRSMDKVIDVYPRHEVNVCMEIGNYAAYTDIVGIPDEQLQKLVLADGHVVGDGGSRPELILGNSIYFYNWRTGLSYSKGESQKLTSLVDTSMPVSFGYGDGAFSARLKVGGVLAGGEEEYSYNSQYVFCDLDKLKRYLKTNSKGAAVLSQPTDANGNPYKDWIYTSAVVTVEDIEDVDFVVKKLQDMGFRISNDKEYLESAKKQMRIIQLLLGGIGAIALVVAIIGISNTMTTSVYDRVNEIGILKVVGCDTDELRAMFLFEAGVLGMAGGVLGVLLSFAIKGIINKAAVKLLKYAPGTQLAVIPPWLIFASVGMAVVLSMLAGYIPARWASKLNPLSAVRK